MPRKKPKMVCRTLKDGTRKCSVKRRRSGLGGTATSVPAPAYINPSAKCGCGR